MCVCVCVMVLTVQSFVKMLKRIFQENCKKIPRHVKRNEWKFKSVCILCSAIMLLEWNCAFVFNGILWPIVKFTFDHTNFVDLQLYFFLPPKTFFDSLRSSQNLQFYHKNTSIAITHLYSKRVDWMLYREDLRHYDEEKRQSHWMNPLKLDW